MKLTELQLEIMDRVRDKILNSEKIFICLAVESVVVEMIREEAQNLRYKAFFFGLRRNKIRKRLEKECVLLSRAIGAGIYPHTTFSGWLLAQLEDKRVLLNATTHRRGRVAWLDRIIDTGELK